MPICFGTNKISTTSPGSFCHPFTYGGGLNAAEFNKDRFDAQIQNTSVPLRIQNLQLSDSALYYCGLRPTVTGNTDSLYQQTIHSIQDRVQALQGDKVTLSCNYSSADSFFWYLQYPSSPPQFLIKEYDKPTRFTLKKDEGRQMFHLEISSVVVTDSALYYCAVRPTLIHSLISIFCSSPECKGEDRVIQTRQDVIATEGHTVSLGCTFETTDTNAYLFWYKQDFNDFPRFILSPFTYGGGLNAAEFNKDRFDAQIQNTSVPLRIQNLQLSDSALYYCGLRPTVTGNQTPCASYQQTIHSIQDRVQALQGDKVTLSCNYSSADSFFWYLQYPSSPPQFLIKEYDKPTRFTLKKDEGRQMFHLEISSVVVTDSALYYCAVRPTVTGNTDSLYKNLTAIQSRYERFHSVTLYVCEKDLMLQSSTKTDLMPKSKTHQIPLRIQNLQLSDSALYYCGDSYQQTVHSIQDRVQALQGDKVTLSCNYSSATYFFWYLQYPSSHPQFLIKEYDKPTRFTLKKDEERQMFHLEISSAEVTDSALYYCAVRSTVTGNTDSLYKNLTAIQSRYEHVIDHSLISIFCSSPECKGEDRVIQTRQDVIATEGHTVRIDCTFETTDTSLYLFWYKQDINDFPRFILSRFTYGEGLNAAEFNKDRFDAQIQNTSVPLRIQNLQLSDSALYYCGLRPTVTGNTDSLYQQTVHSIQDRVQALQGDKVTLSCNYSSADYFFWYLQYPSSPPQLLIKEYKELSGFTLKKDKEMFHLEISSAVVTDSALYYCAVRPTVTGNTDSLYKNLTRNLKSICHRLNRVYSEDLTHMKNEENSLDGTIVTLSYNFSRTAASGDYFFWYRQYPGDAPQYLMYISGLGTIRTAESLGSDKRFSTKLTEDKTGVDLKISSAVVTDSALYYCAVRPTCKGEDRVIQTRQDVIATEGHTVSLGLYLWRTTDTNAYLFWYKQDFNDFPRFILSPIYLSDSGSVLLCLRPQSASYQQTIHSIQDRVQALQGDKVTLSCNYSSADSFFWYLQYPSSPPQFLIKEYDKPTRFTLKKDEGRQMFHLEISSVVVTDSALYYCAVRPTSVKEKTE
ncbi:T cell receptor alpha variable 3 [Merluccius polli]|nr:T cell receptor alpha variable 3 [Merluccius polli]